MKKMLLTLLALTLVMVMSAPALAATYTDVFTNFDQRDTWTDATTIDFTNDGVKISGNGASADGTVVYITGDGTYVLAGECANGQIVVELDKADKAQLVLMGLNLTCLDSAPLYVVSADKVSLTLAEGTVNTFTDGTAYNSNAFDKKPTACIYSRDDLTINGKGELVVNANVNNGIGTSNDLKIVSGTVTVNAANNGLKGNDSIAIMGGTVSVTSKDDGVKTENEVDPGKGYIYVEGGEITITCADDALQATQDITVAGGHLTVSAGGKTINCDGSQDILSGSIN
ncbi:MAG: carbohydrate-binding domain-containing protein [Clostridia bacterium]|nr:carbohydrate-binding domain-containing protein [Clostridia bacterium]